MTEQEEKDLYYKTFRTVLGRGSILTASLLKRAAGPDDKPAAPAATAVPAPAPKPAATAAATQKPAAPAAAAPKPVATAATGAAPAAEGGSTGGGQKKPSFWDDQEQWFDSWMGKGNGQYGQWGMYGLGGGALLGLLSEALSNKEKKNYLGSMLMHGILGSMLTAGGRALYTTPNPSAATVAGENAATPPPVRS